MTDVHVTWLQPKHVVEVNAHADEVYAFAATIPNKHGYVGKNLVNDRLAFMAELAVALFTGLPWRKYVGVRPDKAPDVGDDIDVKWTQHRTGKLLIRHDDNPTWRYVLARGTPPDDLWLSGWVYGDEGLAFPATRPDPARPPVHMIPADSCRPIDALEHVIGDLSRIMTCIACGDDVEVFEAPSPWIDPARYTCGMCLKPVDRPALTLLDERRTESPAYDPTMSQIPF